MTIKLRLVVLVSATIFPSLVIGQAPRTIGFQGFLATIGGDPVPDGPYSVKFAIYTEAVSGTELWNETKTVTTSGGMFDTELGSDSTISGFAFDAQLWLGMTVESDAEMTPRTKLTGVPIALGLAREPKLTYTSINSAKFKPSIVNNTSWYSSTFVDAYIEEGPAGNMVAPVDLPDGVVLKELSAYLFDTSTDDLYCTMWMYHYLLNGTTESIPIFGVNSSSNGGRSWYTDDTPHASTPAAVDNSRQTFAVYCESIGAGWTSVNSDVRITEVVVGYELPSQ